MMGDEFPFAGTNRAEIQGPNWAHIQKLDHPQIKVGNKRNPEAPGAFLCSPGTNQHQNARLSSWNWQVKDSNGNHP